MKPSLLFAILTAIAKNLKEFVREELFIEIENSKNYYISRSSNVN